MLRLEVLGSVQLKKQEFVRICRSTVEGPVETRTTKCLDLIQAFLDNALTSALMYNSGGAAQSLSSSLARKVAK